MKFRPGWADHQLVGTIGTEQAAAVEVTNDDRVASLGGGLPVAVRVAGGEREFDSEFLGRSQGSDRGQGLARLVVDDRLQPHRLAQPFTPEGCFESFAFLEVDGVPVDICRFFEVAADSSGQLECLGRGGGVVDVGGFLDDRFFGERDPGRADRVGQAHAEPVLQHTNGPTIGPGGCGGCGGCGGRRIEFDGQGSPSTRAVHLTAGQQVAQQAQRGGLVREGCWRGEYQSRTGHRGQGVDARVAVPKAPVDDRDQVASVDREPESHGGFGLVDRGMGQFLSVGPVDREHRSDGSVEAAGAAGEVDQLVGIAGEGERVAVGGTVEPGGDGAWEWNR